MSASLRVPVRAGSATPSAARAQLQMRRARALFVLLGFAGLTLLFALLGVAGWWLHLLVDLVLVAYVAHLRLQVVRSAASRRPRRRPAQAAAEAMSGDVERVAVQPGAAADSSAAAAAEPPAQAGWEAVPVPLPTYVTAPVVDRPLREPLVPAPATERFEPDDAEIEVLYQRRWAVND